MRSNAESKSVFDRLIALAQAGDPDAARQLFDRYSHHIIRVVRRRLQLRMRSQFDSTDFAQDVWASFFAEALDRYEFKTPEELVALLSRMAQHKVQVATRDRMRRQKRSVTRERSIEGATRHGKGLPLDLDTPSRCVMAKETMDRLLQDQPPVYQRVLELVMQGYTKEQIANEVGVSERTIRRIVASVHPS